MTIKWFLYVILTVIKSVSSIYTFALKLILRLFLFYLAAYSLAPLHRSFFYRIVHCVMAISDYTVQETPSKSSPSLWEAENHFLPDLSLYIHSSFSTTRFFVYMKSVCDRSSIELNYDQLLRPVLSSSLPTFTLYIFHIRYQKQWIQNIAEKMKTIYISAQANQTSLQASQHRFYGQNAIIKTELDVIDLFSIF